MQQVVAEACHASSTFALLCCAVRRFRRQDSWHEFLETLRRPMPVVVRINRTKPSWKDGGQNCRAALQAMHHRFRRRGLA